MGSLLKSPRRSTEIMLSGPTSSTANFPCGGTTMNDSSTHYGLPVSIPENCIHDHNNNYYNPYSYSNTNPDSMENSFNINGGAQYNPSNCFNGYGGFSQRALNAQRTRPVLNYGQSPRGPTSSPVYPSPRQSPVYRSPGKSPVCLISSPLHRPPCQSPRCPASSPLHGSPGPWHGRASVNNFTQQHLHSPAECNVQPSPRVNASGMQPALGRIGSPCPSNGAHCVMDMNVQMNGFSPQAPVALGVPLEEAIKSQDEVTVADLLEQGYNPNDSTAFGEPLLILAIKTGNEKIVKNLVLAHADINCQDNSLFTPLHYAAKQGHRNLVQFLLSKGANIYARSNNGQLPVNVANDHQINGLLMYHMKSYSGYCFFSPFGMNEMPVNINRQDPHVFEAKNPTINYFPRPVSTSLTIPPNDNQRNQSFAVPNSSALMTPQSTMSPTQPHETYYPGHCSPNPYVKREAQPLHSPLPSNLSSNSKSNKEVLVPSEDLSAIQKDWQEAALNGCAGCGKHTCCGACLSQNKKENDDVGSYAQTNNIRMQWTRGELLGQGSYGKVFAGLNQSTGELMAVKQININELACLKEKAMYFDSLEREIDLYKKLRHKHIVGYIDMEIDHTAGNLYIFLEYVSGGSIHRMLQRFGRFSVPVVKAYTRQLLLGLEYLHANKIVHRDIKGGNVLVDTDGVVKVADFGASKAFSDATVTECCKSIRGSVFWMAPEVIKGESYGRCADIWSVGCTVIEMLTASHPWPGLENTWAAIFHIARANSGPPLPEDIPDILRNFLGHCFQVNAKERPTATELLKHPFLADG